MNEKKGGGKKRAASSLDRLRSGISRETPATRVREAEDDGAGEGESGTAKRRSRGRPAKPKPKERMVRVSVDVPRSRHKYLREYAYDAETDAMSVMRELLEEMRENPGLAARVRDRLAEKAGAE